ncbi:hypothetical protein M2323_004253 [Rhodoblastus acidophilus]|uniref:hypothetical protein n=1 Tax=Rhodoblastus acidophilus TaxID=1074 RepID=UPI00222551BC|nr:hypothetical protein [Rhodoblastus acidophilus]MCW2286458.1 hypothetical protein [Rhodoblastus acidophilus]MCW2335307.1 hypothetical protein [Rhodoblastus acidophilus]
MTVHAPETIASRGDALSPKAIAHVAHAISAARCRFADLRGRRLGGDIAKTRA